MSCAILINQWTHAYLHNCIDIPDHIFQIQMLTLSMFENMVGYVYATKECLVIGPSWSALTLTLDLTLTLKLTVKLDLALNCIINPILWFLALEFWNLSKIFKNKFENPENVRNANELRFSLRFEERMSRIHSLAMLCRHLFAVSLDNAVSNACKTVASPKQHSGPLIWSCDQSQSSYAENRLHPPL